MNATATAPKKRESFCPVQPSPEHPLAKAYDSRIKHTPTTKKVYKEPQLPQQEHRPLTIGEALTIERSLEKHLDILLEKKNILRQQEQTEDITDDLAAMTESINYIKKFKRKITELRFIANCDDRRN